MITILLNIYTFSVLLAIACVGIYYCKLKMIMHQLDVFKILELGQDTKEAIKSMLMCLFCPVFNLIFSFVVIALALMSNDTAASFINKAIEISLEGKREEERKEEEDEE